MQYSFELNKEQINTLIIKYSIYKLNTTTKYMLFRAKIYNATITIFTTNKITIQGDGAESLYNEISTLFNLQNPTVRKNSIKKESFDFNFSIIGTDEVGTGDYFGPIIVCACFVPKDSILEITNLGVTDSKKITDNKILELAPVLMSKLTYTAVSLSNKKYNEISKTTNMNKVKAIMHNEAINKILVNKINYDQIIIDGFTTTDKYFEYLLNKPNVIKNVQLITGGEDKYIAIAAASIIARFYFLKAMDELSMKCNYQLPKGAGKPVDELLSKIIRDNNKDILVNIAKVNFRNTTKIRL